MTESEVRKLLRQMKELDSQTAFRDFYNMTYDRLFRIAYYYVKQEEWSQEIVLDVFLKLWKQRSNLLDVRNIEDYCFILVKNASLNYLEKESKHTYIHPDSLPEPQEQSYSPEESLISEELFALYVKALDRLPERCREVFIRIREEKQSYTQVAEELGISMNTVDAQQKQLYHSHTVAQSLRHLCLRYWLLSPKRRWSPVAYILFGCSAELNN